MAKGEAKRNNQMMDQERNRINTRYDQYDTANRTAGAGAYDRDLALRNQIQGDYQNVLNGPGGQTDPEIRNRILGSGNDLRNWGRNSISSADQNRMRGGGVYDEFAKTGGVSDQEASDLQSRGLSSVGSIFSGLRRQLEQGNSQGYNPGYSAQKAAMARDQGRAITDAAVGTRLGIDDRRNAGRQWGAQGMTSSEGALQSQLASNRLGAYGQAQSGDLGLGNLDLGYAGLNQNRQSNALSGLASLYGARPGETSMYLENELAGLGQRGSLGQNNQAQRNAYNPNVSGWDRFVQLAGAAAPIAEAGAGGGKRSRSRGGDGGVGGALSGIGSGGGGSAANLVRY